jgi:hypothetical protein
MTHEDTPKLWKDMTDEEKGALLLAHHDGKEIEFWAYCEWIGINPFWLDDFAYRVKPEEPKRETVTFKVCVLPKEGISMHMEPTDGTPYSANRYIYGELTVELVDGKPDWDTLKGKEL